MAKRGYKKYMKQDVPEKDYNLIKIFAFSFFGMLLFFTFLIKSFSPSVDVSIGDYKQEMEDSEGAIKNVDGRLAMIQDEDQGRNFSDLMKKADEIEKEASTYTTETTVTTATKTALEPPIVNIELQKQVQIQEPIYKVYIGSYTSAEQAKVAKDIIQESGANLNPIVKCIGSNNYTLQVGSFKNKTSADAMLLTVKQNHLPGRIAQE